jgi:hypothetical protein
MTDFAAVDAGDPSDLRAARDWVTVMSRRP